MDASELKAKLGRAKQRLINAENAMDGALKRVGDAPRREKSIISSALSAAFEELKAARQDLVDLEQAVARDD